MSKPSFRDVERLSAYLDGQLKADEAAQLASRLAADPQLASVFETLRQSRAVLRHLPQRRAPRNFTLTPKMVGQKPPLPRAYPFFRFSAALTAVLLLFTFAINAIGSIPLGATAPVPAYGMGGGGGAAEEPMLALEAPAATETPPEAQAPAAPEPPSLATQTAASPENARAFDATPQAQAKQEAGQQADVQPEALPSEPPSEAPPPNPIPLSWQIALGILALTNAFILFLMQQYAASTWRK